MLRTDKKHKNTDKKIKFNNIWIILDRYYILPSSSIFVQCGKMANVGDRLHSATRQVSAGSATCPTDLGRGGCTPPPNRGPSSTHATHIHLHLVDVSAFSSSSSEDLLASSRPEDSLWAIPLGKISSGVCNGQHFLHSCRFLTAWLHAYLCLKMNVLASLSFAFSGIVVLWKCFL